MKMNTESMIIKIKVPRLRVSVQKKLYEILGDVNLHRLYWSPLDVLGSQEPRGCAMLPCISTSLLWCRAVHPLICSWQKDCWISAVEVSTVGSSQKRKEKRSVGCRLGINGPPPFVFVGRKEYTYRWGRITVYAPSCCNHIYTRINYSFHPILSCEQLIWDGGSNLDQQIIKEWLFRSICFGALAHLVGYKSLGNSVQSFFIYERSL